MPVGGFYVDKGGLDDLERALEQTASGLKDLHKVYRTIGRKAGLYVKTHEPIYAGSKKDSKSHPPPGFMQSRTKGGGGKKGAYVAVSQVPYIYVQEFGGSSFWHRYGAGFGRSLSRKVKASGYGSIKVDKGHIVYTKPRKPKGYFIWNVAWRLRSYIGEQLTNGIADISKKHGLAMSVKDRNLGIEQKSWNRAA
jgi:hypothetical protein